MKKFIFTLIAALLTLGAPALAQSPSPTAPAVALTWNAPTQAWTACSTTVTTACAWYYLVIDATVPASPVTLTPANTLAVSATSYTTPPYSGNVYATRLYNLVLVYKDVNGGTQMNPAANCGTAPFTAAPCAVTNIPVVPPPSPTGLKGTPVTQ